MNKGIRDAKTNDIKYKKGEVFYNTIPCQATLKSKSNAPCKHMAYFALPSGEFVCGQHSLKMKETRKELAKDPSARKNRILELESHRASVFKLAEENVKGGIKGDLKCFHMKMMGAVPLETGRMNIFPNNKHEKREDGYGCPSLSPMRLGPVEHRQLGLPVARNIENYHQFNKVWPGEVNSEGNPTLEYAKMRMDGYNDTIPHRHKFDAKVMKRMREEVKGENRNQPLYSIHLTLDGKDRRFTYVQSRYFYCCAYEVLAKRTEAFGALIKMLDEGNNLTICGYDAYPVTKGLYDHYCDPTKPFGHELVLYTLLTMRDQGELKYPWHRYREEHPKVYENVASVVK